MCYSFVDFKFSLILKFISLRPFGNMCNIYICNSNCISSPHDFSVCLHLVIVSRYCHIRSLSFLVHICLFVEYLLLEDGLVSHSLPITHLLLVICLLWMSWPLIPMHFIYWLLDCQYCIIFGWFPLCVVMGAFMTSCALVPSLLYIVGVNTSPIGTIKS